MHIRPQAYYLQIGQPVNYFGIAEIIFVSFVNFTKSSDAWLRSLGKSVLCM